MILALTSEVNHWLSDGCFATCTHMQLGSLSFIRISNCQVAIAVPWKWSMSHKKKHSQSTAFALASCWNRLLWSQIKHCHGPNHSCVQSLVAIKVNSTLYLSSHSGKQYVGLHVA